MKVYVACAALALVTLPAHAALTIANVHAARSTIVAGEPVAVRFELDEAARVTLGIYDGRDILIRRVTSPTELARGDGELSWDGKDEAGRPVPPEAYTYTLTATQGAQTVTWDVADATGGTDIVAREVTSDATSGKIRYVLDAPARVNVRVGFQNNGPLLRTVVDWVPRAAGANEEMWDGWDASRVLRLTDHPQREVVVTAFRLPENSIIVGPQSSSVKLIDASGWPRATRPAQASGPRRMYAHGQQPLDARGDFGVSLGLPKSLARSPEKVPIVTGPIPVRLEVAAADRSRALARRFEPVFFIDGQFVFENEVGFAPMTWNWDPKGVNPGVHYLTVNLRGYEGNFGMATVKVIVQQEVRR